MAAVARSALCDSLRTTLAALSMDRRLDVSRKWSTRFELTEDCARAVIIPGRVARERTDIGEVTYDYTVAIVVQSRVSMGVCDTENADGEETDVIDEMAEAVHNGLPESVTIGSDTLQLLDSELSEFDGEDWQQRLLFTSVVAATYRQWVAE